MGQLAEEQVVTNPIIKNQSEHHDKVQKIEHVNVNLVIHNELYKIMVRLIVSKWNLPAEIV